VPVVGSTELYLPLVTEREDVVTDDVLAAVVLVERLPVRVVNEVVFDAEELRRDRQ